MRPAKAMKAIKVTIKINMDSNIIETDVVLMVAFTIITTGLVSGNNAKKLPAALSGLSISIAETI